MKQQVSKTLVGGFVVGALALVFAGVMIFGSGKIFEKRVTYVLFFTGSVKGLKVGSSVLFRGVEIGSVTNIELIGDAEKMSLMIPVYVEIQPSKIKVIHGVRDRKKQLPQLIKRGLRAQLQSQSLVTGQLLIELNFHPNTPVRLVGIEHKYVEIPTIPSTQETLVETIKKMDLKELAQNLNKAVAGIERLINSPDVTGAMGALHQTMKDTGKLVRHVDGKIDPLTTDMNATLKDAQKLLNNVNGQVEPLADSLKGTAAAATKALENAEKTIKAMEGVVGKDSSVMYQMNDTLRELSNAARSIRIWAEYMDRHPEALLRGKK
jgi:paraquat-inducible protein B